MNNNRYKAWFIIGAIVIIGITPLLFESLSEKIPNAGVFVANLTVVFVLGFWRVCMQLDARGTTQNTIDSSS